LAKASKKELGMIPKRMPNDALFLCPSDVARHRLGIDRRRVDVEAFAWLDQLADDQADG
jgi:hypothetical protein